MPLETAPAIAAARAEYIDGRPELVGANADASTSQTPGGGHRGLLHRGGERAGLLHR